jgi:hypothetical protein
MATIAIISPQLALKNPACGWIRPEKLFVIQGNDSEQLKEQNRKGLPVTFLGDCFGPKDKSKEIYWGIFQRRLPTFDKVVVYVPETNPKPLIQWLGIHGLVPEKAVFLIPPDEFRYIKRSVVKEYELLDGAKVIDSDFGGHKSINQITKEFLENSKLP